MSQEPLALSREEMQALGYKVVDTIVDHLTTLKDKPTARTASRLEMMREFKEGFPDAGSPIDEVLDTVTNRIFK